MENLIRNFLYFHFSRILKANSFYIFVFFLTVSTVAQAQWVVSGTLNTSNQVTGGNVGIGTNSPGNWFGGRTLEISDTRPILKLSSTLSNGLSTLLFTNSNTNASTHLGEFHVNYEFNPALNHKSRLRFSSYPAGELMTLVADGNVGIGTLSPAARLHLRKEMSVSEATATPVNDLLNLTLRTPDGFVPAKTESRINFKLEDWSNGEVAFAAIGMEKETDLLGAYSGSKLKFYTNSPAYGAQQPGHGLIEAFTVDRFGNASIFTTVHYEAIPAINTALKLRLHTPNVHVPYGTENRISFVTKAFTNNELEISAIATRVGAGESGSWGGGEILFYTRDSSPGANEPGAGLLERMRLDVKGRLGIGTTDPDEALTVRGTIHTNEVRVDLNSPIQGPDYVFEKNYNLLSLGELETYIHQNKHLPEVPSAKEMYEEGLNLKEMNLLLLKKVEELTLHLIELKKENETIKITVEKLVQKTSK